MRKHWVLIASGKACSIEGPWRDWFIPFVGRGYSVGAETSWNHEASRSSFMDKFLMDFLWLLYGCFQHLSAVAFSCQQSSAAHGWGAEIPLDAKTMHSTVPLQFLHWWWWQHWWWMVVMIIWWWQYVAMASRNRCMAASVKTVPQQRTRWSKDSSPIGWLQ